MERQANFTPFSTSALTLNMLNEAFYNLMVQALMLTFDKYYNYLSILKELCSLIFKLASHGPKNLYGILF